MRSALTTSLLTLPLAASLLVGCADDPAPGPYRVVTTVDFTEEAIPPRQIEDVVATLRDFSARPGETLLDLAERRGVEAVAVLRGGLPLSLASRLEGWIDEEIQKGRVGDKPVTEYATHIATFAEVALTRFAVESELALDDDAPTHRITGLDLSPAGLELRLSVDAIEGDVLMQQPAISVVEPDQLSLGAQRFGLAYGAYAWQGIEAASGLVYGDGVRPTLGAGIDCAALAKAVSEQCLIGVCVGHEAELRATCDGGLDAVVDLAHEKLAEIRLGELHLAQGNARLVDDDGDGAGDRITDGVWQAELDLGLGPHAAPASFLGAR